MNGTTNSAGQKWTILVYMAADNNLSDRCVDDIREMKMAGLNGEATVKVQMDRSSAFGNETKRYIIKGCPLEGPEDTAGSLIYDEVATRFRHVNTGRMGPLIDFIQWGLKGSKDDKIMLVLWGHASPADNLPIPDGVLRGQHSRRRRRLARQLANRADSRAFFRLCADDFTGDGLSDIELKNVLRIVTNRIGRRIDILGLDACLLSMVELSYEMREYVNYIVASESLIPATSWPYHWILGQLRKDPDMSAKELCRTIVQKYIAFYADYDDIPVQLSACDLSKAQQLTDAVAVLAESLRLGVVAKDSVLINTILSAHFRAQGYYLEQYYDLYDFCFMLKDSCGQNFPEVQAACDSVMNELGDGERDGFIVASDFHNFKDSETDLQFSYGTSIYFPWNQISERYTTLEFAHVSKWLPYLEAYNEESKKFSRDARKQLALLNKPLAQKPKPIGESDMPKKDPNTKVEGSTTKVEGSTTKVEGSTTKVEGSTTKNNGESSTKSSKKVGIKEVVITPPTKVTGAAKKSAKKVAIKKSVSAANKKAGKASGAKPKTKTTKKAAKKPAKKR